MIPPGCPVYRCKQLSSVRTISLTPPGISSSQILKFLIPIITEGTMKEFEGAESEVNSAHTLLEVCGLFGDYLALWQATDVMKHSDSSPPMYCTFLKK